MMKKIEPHNVSGSYSTNSRHEAAIIQARNANIMEGFTGQWLGGACHDKRHCKDYEQYPNVNKILLEAARLLDGKVDVLYGRTIHAQAVNFILFHNHYLDDDDMYWLSSIFNSHPDLAVNTVDLSNNNITLTTEHDYKDLPFFSFNSPYNSPRKILRLDLSNNKINDEGAAIIANGLANGVLPITKLLNLGGNQITSEGFPKMMDIISRIDQEIFIITEKNESLDEGTAVFKSTDGHLYDFKLTSDGKECSIEFADGITGISGISAGDTCPPSVKEQMKACFIGGVSTTVGNWEKCSGVGNFKAKLVCSGSAFLTGCAIGTATIATANCVNAEHYRDHDHDSNFGFSATGGTEIKGTYIDNSCVGDSRCMGSAFDLNQHDF